MPHILEQKISGLVFIYLLLIFGYIFSLGFFYFPGLILVVLAAILLFIYQIKGYFKIANSDIYNLFVWVLILLISLSIALYGGLYQTDSGYTFLGKALLFFAILIAFLYVFEFLKSSFVYKSKFLILFLIAISLRILMIWSSPAPYIDVFYIQKIAPKALTSGANPYSIMYPKLYPNEIPDVFSYEPAVIFLDMPSVLLTGDPRYTMAFAEIATAFIVYLILRKNIWFKKKPKTAEVLALLFLYNPRSLFIVEQAWVDPILIFFISLFIYFLFFSRRRLIAFAILGIVLSVKQYSIFLIPFLARGGYLKIRSLIVPLGIFLGFTLPFFIWNSADFLHDVVFYNLLVLPRHDSLSLNSLLWRYTSIDIPTVIFFVIGSLLLLILLKYQKKSPGTVFLAAATFSLSIFLIYKLAFIHYFYFAGSLLLLSIVLLMSEPQKVDG